MESSVKRIVDYKLLYDSLADPSNGMIQVATLTARWPKDLAASIKLPRGLPDKWRAAADDNGYLDWEKFSSALKKALEEDKPRLLSSDGSQTPPNFGTEEKMSNFQQRKVGAQAPRVRAEEIELFLSRCKGDILAQALSRTRKEVYKCQMSLHQLESASNRAAAASSSGKVAQPKQSDPSSINVKVPLVNALSNVGQEKEELLKGMEVMEITRLWFNSRLEQLALEQKQPAKTLKPEELLAALDRREEQPISETLKHIQEINSHLGKLAKEAPGLSLEQLKKQYHHQQQQRKQNIKAVASDPGPFSQSKSAGQRGGGPVKATTTTIVKMNFPAYSPPSNVHVGPSRVSSPPVRSSSMREFHTVRGEMKEEGSHGAPMARPSTTHRSVSMSTQNLTDNQRHGDNQAYYYQQHHHIPNKPRRSQSFNEKSMSSSPGSSGSGGSLVQQSGLSLSSASTSSTGSSGTSTLEYPSKASSHSHSHSGYRTYPLRETSSLQTLPSSASSYGGNAATSTKSSHGMDGHLHHQNKHGSHHGGHHGQIRSSSVRNIPSASGYNNNIAVTTTIAAVSSASSSSSSSSLSSQQSGRPIFSQPMSASSGRVESVDIPSQPQQLSNTSTSTAMATNMRHSDLSSSYPGHHHGHGHSRAGHGSSSSSIRGTSGQIQHGHGGSRGSGGENPKQSRRHLHKAVQEQSLRIKQLEAENAALTRERGSYVSSRGQKQQHKATAAAGHPVIKTSALQSVV